MQVKVQADSGKMDVNQAKQEHLLALKGDLFGQLMKEDPSTIKGAETIMLGEMLTLPQNFGNIFLGETFSSYISVHNDSTQVVKDILVKTDEVFLEAQIQNITTSPMFMEKVSLEPSIMYNVTELNTVSTGEEGASTFGKMSYLQPMDTRQYLYCLKPKPEFAEKAGVIKGVTVIGKLDIAPGYGDVRLSLELIPDTVNLEEPFDITCKITNCSSERTMDLVLEMCNTNSIHWCGISGRQLGKLNPSSSLYITLKLLSSVQGLQSISGLRLTDTFLKRTYEYDDIAQVCVVCSHMNPES
ncbi:UNVERIFIED_CONTAM: hypothetical protein FKN15_047682 [Acipenser sinensis]